jgi:hypothetical protein
LEIVSKLCSDLSQRVAAPLHGWCRRETDGERQVRPAFGGGFRFMLAPVISTAGRRPQWRNLAAKEQHAKFAARCLGVLKRIVSRLGGPSTALRFGRHDRLWPHMASPDRCRICHRIPTAPGTPRRTLLTKPRGCGNVQRKTGNSMRPAAFQKLRRKRPTCICR